MSEIKSSLGNFSFPSGQKPIYAVSDESTDLFEIPGEAGTSLPQPQGKTLTVEEFKDLQAKKQQFRATTARPTSEARQRVELLTGIGRLETNVELEDHKFVLQSLKHRETREVVKAAAGINLLSEQLFELRVQTLARSITHIDGHPAGLILGNDSLDTKVAFLENCEEHVVSKLYHFYSEMMKQFENKFAIKSPTDAQDVGNEIKK